MKALTECLVPSFRKVLLEAKYNEEAGLNALYDYPNLRFNKLSKAEQAEVLKYLRLLYGDAEPYVIAGQDTLTFKIPRAITNNAPVPKGYKHLKIEPAPGKGINLFVRGKKIGESGNGSLGRVSTANQEEATCCIWNAYAAAAGDLDLGASDYKAIKTSVAHLGEELTKNTTWLSSFPLQIESIIKFLKAKGIKDDEIWEYRATRYGVDNEASKAHAEFLRKYLQLVKTEFEGEDSVIQKDNYDPSDILLYKTGEQAMAKLKNVLAGVKADGTGEALRDVFVRYSKLYEEGILFGISLKQAKGEGSYEEFNIYKGGVLAGKATSHVSSATTTAPGQGRMLLAKGKFSFDGAIDPTTLADKYFNDINETSMNIALRSFGRSGAAMDVKASHGPALGKIPARLWRRALGLPNTNTELKLCLDAWDKVFGVGKKLNKKQLDLASQLISAGIKNGPWCLPFVLIH